MTNMTAMLIAIVCLYSTHHWIGATVLLVLTLWAHLREDLDPLGVNAVINAIRRYRS